MKVLFIGGTGIISSACSRLAIDKGIELYHFNRGKSHRKIDGVRRITGDIRNKIETKNALQGLSFDAVVNWISFNPEQVRTDIELFTAKTKQYVFISSASAYQKPITKLPITEDTPLINPFWRYSRDKAACERVLMEEYKTKGFPVTIVRPSHTYDNTLLPTDWGYTVLDRIRKRRKVIIHGDGTSLWVMTHSDDFAPGLVGLLGNPRAIGEAFHITSDEHLHWNAIYQLLADALNVSLNAVHIPSDFIARRDGRMGASLLGDKAHSVIFDNAKIKNLVPEYKPQIPFQRGIADVISWYRDHPNWQIVDQKVDATIERIIREYEK